MLLVIVDQRNEGCDVDVVCRLIVSPISRKWSPIRRGDSSRINDGMRPNDSSQLIVNKQLDFTEWTFPNQPCGRREVIKELVWSIEIPKLLVRVP